MKLAVCLVLVVLAAVFVAACSSSGPSSLRRVAVTPVSSYGSQLARLDHRYGDGESYDGVFRQVHGRCGGVGVDSQRNVFDSVRSAGDLLRRADDSIEAPHMFVMEWLIINDTRGGLFESSLDRCRAFMADLIVDFRQ